MATEANSRQEVSIQARVFRARQDKPRYLPTFMWLWARRLRLPGTGRWENLGEVASSKKGNIEIK